MAITDAGWGVGGGSTGSLRRCLWGGRRVASHGSPRRWLWEKVRGGGSHGSPSHGYFVERRGSHGRPRRW